MTEVLVDDLLSPPEGDPPFRDDGAAQGSPFTTAVAAAPTPWTASEGGPGSPPGSVRPPDTIGTVDAPPATAMWAAGPRGRGLPVAIGGAIVGAVLGTVTTLAVVAATDTYRLPPSATGATTSAPATTTTVVEVRGSDDGDVVPAVAEAVTPSVVRVDVIQGDGADSNDVALGSGVIFRADGYVLTNNHVVAEGDAIRVRLASGESLEAEVVGTDPQSDLAVLKVDRVGLPAVAIRSTSPRVGEVAIAIGSPFGLDTSVTAGVVSALNRNIPGPDGTVIGGVVQTDAAINPGNSGGPLVDREGRLIGINTAILSDSGGNQGVGFAIPSTIALEVAEELIASGFVRHAFLGITGVDLSDSAARSLGLERGGAIVESVQADSAADDAGLQPADVIVEVDGEPLASMTDLVVIIRRRAPGDAITLTVLRDGQEVVLTAELGERPR